MRKTAGLSASISAWLPCEALEEPAVPTRSTRRIPPVRLIPRLFADRIWRIVGGSKRFGLFAIDDAPTNAMLARLGLGLLPLSRSHILPWKQESRIPFNF